MSMNSSRFNPIDGNRFIQMAKIFDANQDDKLSVAEMKQAHETLSGFGSFLKIEDLTNMATAFDELAKRVEKGDKYLDRDEDKALEIESYQGIAPAVVGWKAPPSELKTIIYRNIKSKFEFDDLIEPTPLPPPKTRFSKVKDYLVKALFRFFDKGGDGKLTIAEMEGGQNLLDRAASLMGGNSLFKNLANMFKRLIEEVKEGNEAVDSDGDQAIRYINAPAKKDPQGMPIAGPPNELQNMLTQNEKIWLEMKDTVHSIGLIRGSIEARARELVDLPADDPKRDGLKKKILIYKQQIIEHYGEKELKIALIKKTGIEPLVEQLEAFGFTVNLLNS